MQIFKFDFDVALLGGYPRNNQRNERLSGQNWNSGRANNHNCSYSLGHGDDRRDNGGSRGSYNSNPSNRSSSVIRYRLGFNGSNRSPESAGNRGDDSYQDFQDYKRWKDDHCSSSRRIRNDEHDNEENDHKLRRKTFRG